MQPCIFCDGDHYNDQCDKYTTLVARIRKLNEKKRCFICLKPGHVLKSCPNLHKRCCDHCGKRGYHNCCLCPEKFSGDDTNNDSFCVTQSDNVTGIGDATLTAAGKVPLQSTSATQCAGQSDTQFTQYLLAAGERVLLQTAIVPVQSSDGGFLLMLECC